MLPTTCDRRFAPRGLVAVVAFTLAAIVGSACSDGSDDEVDGRALFETNCAACHGADGSGNELGPSVLAPSARPDQLDDQELAAVIRDGIAEPSGDDGPMPGFPGFTEDELEALIATVRELQGSGADIGG